MPWGIRPSRLRRGSSDTSLVPAGRLGQRESLPESGRGGEVLLDAGAAVFCIDVRICEELLEVRIGPPA